MNRVYRQENYNVYQVGDGYIIHNTNKQFDKGHTHVKNFKTTKFLIDLCIHKSMPHHLCKRFLISLSRITEDENYRQRLLDLYDKKDKKQVYVNRHNYSCKN